MDATRAQRKVDLEGALLVDRAAGLKTSLTAALAGADDVIVDISGVSDLDLACLQVLYAARRQAKEAGKRLGLYGLVAPKIANRLTTCGFLRTRVERAEEFESALIDF